MEKRQNVGTKSAFTPTINNSSTKKSRKSLVPLLAHMASCRVVASELLKNQRSPSHIFFSVPHIFNYYG